MSRNIEIQRKKGEKVNKTTQQKKKNNISILNIYIKEFLQESTNFFINPK